MIFKLRNTNLRSDGTNFFVRYIPPQSSSSSSSSSQSSSSSGSGSSQGPNSILACGFGSFADGQFSSAGYFNGYEYYTLIDGATTWYLFYDSSNLRYAIATVLSNGNASYYNTSTYLYNDWTVSSGNFPGGDTYDYDTTPVCPTSSSSSQGSINGPNSILVCGFGSFADGQFTSSGYYNDYEYYTYYDSIQSFTTWYLYYDSGNNQFVIAQGLGGSPYYYTTGYIMSDWTVSMGNSPGGDTYDYDVTSQCPPPSSSSSGSISGPNNILACGFGSFADGQFTSGGYYNGHEYYTYYDNFQSFTTWYLYYDSISTNYYISTSLGGTAYYYNGSYASNDWYINSGSSPGGDTYDYDLTSQCPPASSSSGFGGSSSSGPETPIIMGVGYDGIIFAWTIGISNFNNFMSPTWLIQYSTDNFSWGSSFSPNNTSNPDLIVDDMSYNLPGYSNGTDFYVRVSADNGSNWSSSYFVDN